MIYNNNACNNTSFQARLFKSSCKSTFSDVACYVVTCDAGCAEVHDTRLGWPTSAQSLNVDGVVCNLPFGKALHFGGDLDKYNTELLKNIRASFPKARCCFISGSEIGELLLSIGFKIVHVAEVGNGKRTICHLSVCE
jgi:hypothetical protein